MCVLIVEDIIQSPMALGFAKTMENTLNRKFKCVETGKIIGDIEKLCKQTGLGKTTLYRYIKMGKSCRGNHYIVVKDPHPGRGMAKPIQCQETEKIYDSIGQAAVIAKVSPQALSQCLKGKAKTCGGFHWCYA